MKLINALLVIGNVSLATVACSCYMTNPGPALKLPQKNPPPRYKSGEYPVNQPAGTKHPDEIIEEWRVERGEQHPLFPATRITAVKKLHVTSKVTAAQLDNFLQGKLAGKGKVFIAAAKKYGIDPALMAAISTHETGYGKSPTLLEKNNPAGLMKGGKYFLSFRTLDEGIYAFAERLKTRYYDCGLKTIEQIQPKYAPAKNCANDPKGLNAHWLGGVKKFYSQVVNS